MTNKYTTTTTININNWKGQAMINLFENYHNIFTIIFLLAH